MASIDEIWLADFGDPHPAEPAGRRPALVLGPPATFGDAFPFVIVAPLTTTHRGLSLHVEIDDDETTGLAEPSYVQCELIRSINRQRLIHRLGHITEDTSVAVSTIVRTLLNH